MVEVKRRRRKARFKFRLYKVSKEFSDSLPFVDRAVLTAILDCRRDEQTVRFKSLAKQTTLDRRTIRSAIGRLAAAGHVRKAGKWYEANAPLPGLFLERKFDNRAEPKNAIDRLQYWSIKGVILDDWSIQDWAVWSVIEYHRKHNERRGKPLEPIKRGYIEKVLGLRKRRVSEAIAKIETSGIRTGRLRIHRGRFGIIVAKAS